MAVLSASQTQTVEARTVTSVAALVALGAIFAVAAFLRLYELTPFAWVPDQYERLIEARELLSGQLPDSVIYPPGMSLLLAPFVALLGSSVGTMQAMTIVFSLALVPVAHYWVSRTTGDRMAAVLLAGACAAAPALVGPARNGYVDSVVTLLIIVAFVAVPMLKGRGLAAFACYGLLLALLFNIRPTNVFVVPPLLLYWLAESGIGWRLRDLLHALLSREMIATAAAMAVPCAISVLAGNWYGGAYGGLVSFDSFFSNLTFYWSYLLTTWFGGLILAGPVIIGVVELWHRQRPLALGLLSFLVSWPAVHSPFLFADGRYMVPALVILLFFAAIGFSRAFAGRTFAPPRLARYWCTVSFAGIVLLFGAGSAVLLSGWDQWALESDAGLASDMRPVIKELPADSLMISAVTRAFSEDGFEIEYLDLFDQAVLFKDRQAGVTDLERNTRVALAEGKAVYYLYSHLEADNRIYGGVWDSFRAYFDGLDKEYEATEVYRAEHRRGGNEPWVLYELTLPGSGGGPPPAGPQETPAP